MAPKDEQQPDEVLEASFDADARAAERAKKGVKVNGVVYKRRKKTGALVKEIIKLAPHGGDDEDADLTPDQQAENIDILFKQAALLLVDPATGESPDWEELSGENGMDFEDARDMVAVVMGNAEV